MGYCTRGDIENVIAQALTSSTASTPDSLNSTSSLLNIGNVMDNNVIPQDIVDSYIRIADSQINGICSELYKTPFIEIVDVESILFSDINEYNPYIVLDKVVPLSPGDIVILYQNGLKERHKIDEQISDTVFSTVDPIRYFFLLDTRVVRVTYPNPIRWISARASAANIYDKYFSAEVSPSTSTFGDKLRELANTDLNNVLIGTIILEGQHRIGRRFLNSQLIDQYALPRGGALPKEMRQMKMK